MDREISRQKKTQRKTKVFLFAIAALALIAFGFIKIKQIAEPSISPGAFMAAAAEEGPMEATVPASGIIIPEYELSITSPVSAKIEQAVHRAGESVHAGQIILQLNKESSLLAYEKLNEEQQVNRNKIHQLQLGLEKNLNDLKTQHAIKKIKISSLETALEHEQLLLTIGGSTEESVKQARLNLHVAKLELTQLKNQIANQQATMKADLKSLGYEISIRSKDLREISSKLKNAAITSPRGGVITWLNDKIGSEINEGDELVRIADLSSFKAEAAISDTYANEVKTGRTALVQINGSSLQGKISNVQPAVENGTVKFTISLNDKSSRLLRPNLKADVFVVTSNKSKAVRVKNGPAFNGSAVQTLFVLNEKNAVSRKVKIGESNAEYAEILSGIKAGEKVIISDMQDFEHLGKIQIK